MDRCRLALASIAALLLVYAVVMTVLYALAPQTETAASFPLDMAPEAVDDMYDGCRQEMEKKVNDTYFNRENVGIFHDAWKNAEACSNKSRHPGDGALSRNHLRAICAYTSDDIHAELDEAVRTNSSVYASTFRYHALHFWLTTAIQTLNTNHTCHMTYRRSRSDATGKVDDIIRFGSFTSSSLRTDLELYGHETCFQIETCAGADLKDYPVCLAKEQEVLIPPYETFKITQVIEGRGGFEPMPDCRKVFILKSERNNVSNLNCRAAN